MILSDEEWQIIRRAAKYTNGTVVPQHMKTEAIHALHKLVKTLDRERAISLPVPNMEPPAVDASAPRPEIS